MGVLLRWFSDPKGYTLTGRASAGRSPTFTKRTIHDQRLAAAAAQGLMPDYIGTLLAAFEAEEPKRENTSYLPPAHLAQLLSEPLSHRELEILQLMAQGLSNRAISERLFLAVSTVKGHNQTIFGKLQVQRRTEAVARARELGLV